jgi:MFS family permease
METLILGWYVLVETGSVFLLTLFASLQHIGTLIAPMFGVMGDRIGHRNVLCAMRGVYATCAVTVMTLAFTGILAPAYVLAIAGIMGLVRPSDIGMRAALVGATMPSERLIGAMSIQRTTQDTARIAGALTGAGVVAMLGIGPAYAVVATLYVTRIVLTLRAGSARPARAAATGARPSPWRDLKEGLAYVWNTPYLLAVMCLAFVLNMTAFPQFHGLLPYVAKEVYRADQTWLGYMVAGAAFGALVGAIVLSRHGGGIMAGRMTIIFCAGWYAMLLVFAQLQHPFAGIAVLFLAGVAQSLGQVPMVTLLLRNSDERYRGRIMGIRMLMIYGNLPGLLLAGPLITHYGYPVTGALYCTFGLLFTALIAIRWRTHLWRLDAPANLR